MMIGSEDFDGSDDMTYVNCDMGVKKRLAIIKIFKSLL